MLTRFTPRNFRPRKQMGGLSLIWMLFPAVVLVMVVTFLAFQFLGIDPDTAGLSLAERMDLGRLAGEAGDIQVFMLPLMVLMMVGVLATLHLGLWPLRKISERAADIGPATIGQRLPLSSAPREIAPLVAAFNGALDRLEAGWRAQREFSANAAHELRTPLATLRAQVESVLPPNERKEAIEEFDRLSRLITQLLSLAEAEGGKYPGRAPFNLVELARALASDMASTIVASGRGVAFESAHERWDCCGAPSLVEIALRNLLENATRHTPPGTEILVSIDASGHLIVSDDGPGVPPAFQDRLFQRFSKADVQGFGAGLGLSIINRVMELHGGVARLDPSPIGARFVLDFTKRGDAELSNARALRPSKSWPLLMPLYTGPTVAPYAEGANQGTESSSAKASFGRRHA
jgi:signal transduction histidine kinase